MRSQTIPHRRDLVRQFTDAVTTAVEATIVARTRKLIAEHSSSGRVLESGAHVTEVGASDWPTLAQHQWSYIQRVLERTQGNRSEAATILGLHRRSLQRLLARGRARALSRRRGHRRGKRRTR